MTWEEAKPLLEEYRGYLIERGRYEAVKIALRDGTVHARQVRKVMKEAGLLHPDLDERWMGVVFSKKTLFKWTKRYLEVDQASPRSRGGGGGGRPIRVWELQKGVVLPPEPKNVPKPGLLSEVLGPPKPDRKVFKAAMADLRKMQQAATKAGFKFSDVDASKKLGTWLRYQSEIGE